MNFEHPKVLWISLVLLPLLALFLWATWRKRQALVRQFLQHKVLAQQTLGTSFGRQKLRRILLFLVVGLLLLTIAGPQWGFTWEEASQRGRDIIVAIDTSRSMLAEDIQPNRLARAKLAALDLLQIGKFDRFGLVVFAGTAFLQCPLTFDDEAFRQNVRLLEPGIIPQGGTAIGGAIQAAREAFEKDADDNHRVLILFTDGEDHEAGVMEKAREAAADGMRIFTVGVGSAAGELLRVRDERGNLSFLKDEEGNVVKSRLNEQLLQEIASGARGFYLPLQGGNAMEQLYQKGLAELPTSERTTKLMKKFKEQFYWPLAAAILLLIIELFIPEQARVPRNKGSNTPASAPAAAALLALLLLSPETWANASKAQRYYRQGQYQSALSEYQELLAKGSNDPRLHYNAGAAAYHAEKFDLAMRAFQAAAGSSDLDLQQQSFYNMANAEFRLGESIQDPQQKMALWEQAVQHYDTALKLNSQDKDAEFNRDLVKRKLDELKKQQQQEQKQNQNQDNKDENRDDKDDSSKEEQQKENQDEQEKDSQEQKQEDNQQQNQDNQQSQDQKNQNDQPQQEQQKPDQQQNDQQQPSQQGGDKESTDEPQEGGETGEAAQLGQMTPAQARQLLDAQREEEKALIFVPSERKSEPRNRNFKDW